MTAEPIVVGVLYPRAWYGDPDGFADEITEIAAVDSRLEVVVEEYAEPHDLRTARGQPGTGDLREQVPPLTPAQRDVFARLTVALAIDLPYDVATVAPYLRWVQAVGAGTAQLQSAGLGNAGIHLTSNAGSNSVAIAEFVVGRILQEWKRFRQLDGLQSRHAWEAVFGEELAGATVGLIGLGAINAAVAARLRGFGVRVLATRRSATPGATAPDVDELYPTAQLHELLQECDIVVAAVPETAETRGMFDEAAFAAVKPGAFFVNVGRGSLVDEPALINALKAGQLRAAALDVASVEPLPADHPLWDAPNLYISPHSATSPSALFRNIHRVFRDNLARFLAGEPLRNEVDVTRGY